MYLLNFENDESKIPILQSEALAWLADQHSFRSGIEPEKLIKMLERFGCGPDKIHQRRVWLPEFSNQPTLFVKSDSNPEIQPSLEERMVVFKKALKPSVQNLFQNSKNEFTHLLHVSCTGYESPSLAQELVLEKNWSTIVQHIYHLGCYAAVPAIRTAQGLLSSEKECKVQILHTEFCSLHANLLSTTPEQLVVQSLFADACIKYEAHQIKPNQRSLQLLATHEMLIPDSQSDMTWQLANFGFSMTLSRDVPQKIGQYLNSFLKVLFKKAQLDISELKTINMALHPGGPKIIQSVQKILELSDEQIKTSEKILFENGNMSSATVPFIWKDILKNESVTQSPYVLSLAFGPGLTIAGSLLCLQD